MEGDATIFARIDAGDAAAVAALLDADPSAASVRNESGDSPLLVALYSGRRDIAEILLARGAETDLFEACALGLDRRVRELLEQDPALLSAYSHDGWTALHLASFFGHGEIVSLLLAQGADVNARSRSARFAASNTPLHAAAANRQTAVAEILLEHGADVNARDGSGFTPLGLAANTRNDLLVIRLLELGAQVS